MTDEKSDIFEAKIKVRDKGEDLIVNVFSARHDYLALEAAKECAGDKGFLASAPKIVEWIAADRSYNLFDLHEKTGFSEESVGQTKQGTQVVAISHGAGILLCSPERFKEAELGRSEALEAHNADHNLPYVDGGLITDSEMYDLLDGKLPDGSEIAVYPYKDFEEQSSLPDRYVIVLDARTAKCQRKSHYDLCTPEDFNKLLRNEHFIARAGCRGQAEEFLMRSRREKERKSGFTAQGGRVGFSNSHELDRPYTRPYSNLLAPCGSGIYQHMGLASTFLAVSEEDALKAAGQIQHQTLLDRVQFTLPGS